MFLVIFFLSLAIGAFLLMGLEAFNYLPWSVLAIMWLVLPGLCSSISAYLWGYRKNKEGVGTLLGVILSSVFYGALYFLDIPALYLWENRTTLILFIALPLLGEVIGRIVPLFIKNRRLKKKEKAKIYALENSAD